MANENVPASAPTRSDGQILPFAVWVPIGKSNFVLDCKRKQKNSIFQIFVDILKNINFFRAFTASASVPAIYLQQLDINLLKEALEITPIDQAYQFVSPPSGDAIMDCVNQLGYPGEIQFVLRMASWISSSQMLWGIITRSNIDYAEFMWEEFVQAIQTFLVDKANLGRHHNIHQRSGSPLNLVEDDLSLGNLKFVPKGEIDEVFGMQIPKELVTENIKNAPYYNDYLEMVAKHKRRIVTEKEGGKKKMAPKASKPVKLAQAKPTIAKQPKPKPIKEKSTKPAPLQKACKGEEYDLERAIQMSLESFQTQGQAHVDAEIGVDMDNVISEGDTKILNIGEEQGEDVDNQVYLEEQTAILDEGHAGSDPGKTLESRPPPDDDKMDEDQAGSDPGKSYVALAGPNPEPMHDDFVATVYPKVHESLKFPADEQVILEDLLSSSGTLFSMKNLDDTYTFGDQFFNDKSTEDEPGKQNVDAEFVSMVTVPIHQASTSVPPLSTPIIDLLPPQSVAYPLLEPFTTATTETTTTTLPLPPPPQQQSIIDSELPAHVIALEKKFVDFEQKSQTLDNMTQNLGSRAIHIAFQAPLRDRFREMPEDDMKKFFIKGYEFLDEKDKSQKRRRNDQDPPPPPDSDLSKKKRHNSAASGSKQPPAPQSSAKKTSDTKEAPSSSSKQHSTPQSEQPVEDVLVPDTMNISDSEDIECHLLLTDQVDLVNPEGHRVVPDVSKPLPLGGPPSQELVPSLWIESEREYDTSAAYGISHWWFKRKEFYITRHSAPSDRSTVRSYMRILSVVSLKTFEKYGYTFLKEIVLHRADYNEYKILEVDFKNLHLNDFEDLYLLYLQGQLNHLSSADKVHLFNAVNLWIRNIVIRKRVEDLQLRIKSYQTKLNLTQLNLNASNFLFKEDYTIVSKLRAVIFRDSNDQKKMMQETEVHKFSNGTLNRILDKMDHIVKYFKMFKYNSGMETRIWSEDDRRRSKEFIKVIERRLKIRRIFKSLESFVGGSEDGNPARANIKQALGSDDQSFSDEDFPKKIYLNPLFDEEIIPMEIDQHSFNAESDLIESLPNHDSSVIISSKIDSLFDEFAGELTLLKSFLPGIDETDCHPEKQIRLTKRLLYDNSSPRPPEEIVSDNSIADIESFSPSHIPNEDKLLDNYSLSLPANELYHFDILLPYRPPAKPPDGNTRTLNIKMIGDVSDQKIAPTGVFGLTTKLLRERLDGCKQPLRIRYLLGIDIHRLGESCSLCRIAGKRTYTMSEWGCFGLEHPGGQAVFRCDETHLHFWRCYIVDLVAEEVLNRAGSWTDYDGELPVIALDVERLIFKDLVKEVVLGEAFHGKRIQPGKCRRRIKLDSSGIFLSHLFYVDDLELPISTNMNLISSWQILIDRFQKRLSSWKANLLSISGRLTLIKAVSGSLGIYYLSIFKAPETILISMESLRFRFFWGGSQDSRNTAWVKWCQVLSSFEKGGLQIGSLKAFNLALLQKWRWRLLSSPNNMWVNIIKALHGQEGGLNNQGCNFNGTWYRIIGTSNILHSKGIIPLNSFCFKVGCDTRVCFWKDIWIGDSPLHTRYNRLYRLDQDKECLIIDRIFNGQWHWNWSMSDIATHNMAYLNDLLLEVSQIDISVDEDTCTWVLSNDGTFSVKSARRLIDSKLLPSISTPTVWD
nr:hypothetical protein [Tanacetum cinerariifolium]